MTPLEEQELLIAAYSEEQDKWSKDVAQLEQGMLTLQKRIRELRAIKPTLKERIRSLLGLDNVRLAEIHISELMLSELCISYERRLNEMPKYYAYELAMLGNNIFKPK